MNLMVQNIATLIIVATASIYAVYEIAINIYRAFTSKTGNCHGCNSCNK